MPFTRLRLRSFRNLEDAVYELGAERVFLVGENGQGKTNLLEALYYLSYASSFRGPVDAEAAKGRCGEFLLEGDSRRELSERDAPPETLRLHWKAKAKELRRDGKLLHDRKELVSINPSIVYCHQDFDFAAGEPERRRFFFDQSASLVSAGYIDLLRDYKRVLKQRNVCLKERRLSLLDLLDEQLAGIGVQLRERRVELEKAFCPLFTDLYETVANLGREIRVSYRPSWPQEAEVPAILERLAGRREDELRLGTSLSGPHRDRWQFMSGDEDFAATASTGQLRLISLCLRTVQARYYTEATGRLPVLLLDDVLLELDPAKRARFVAALPDSAQAFFTFLPGEAWEDYRGGEALVYRVADGRLTHQGRG